MRSISFFVPGLPRPAGSKRAFVVKGRAIVTDANPNIREWKNAVTHEAAEAMRLDGRGLFEGPLNLNLFFAMPRPKGHYRTGKRSGSLRENAPIHHTTKPDATKLTRGTEDALTGIVWKDDSQIASQHITKTYDDQRIGCLICVSEIVD